MVSGCYKDGRGVLSMLFLVGNQHRSSHQKKKNCLDVLYSIANPMFVFGCLLAQSLIAFTSTDAWFVAIPDNITTNYCIAINISFLLSS